MTSMHTKKLIGAAAFSLVLAGGGVAGALIGRPLSSGAAESTAAVAQHSIADHKDHLGHRHRHGPGLAAAAKAIGISVDALRTELEAGKTIAEVAHAHGVDVNTVIDAMVKEATANIRDRITALVNGQRPAHGGRGHRGELRAGFAKVAHVIGISSADLRTALQGGQSLAGVATAHHVEVQKVIDVLVAAGVPADRATAIVNHTGGFHHGPGEPAPNQAD